MTASSILFKRPDMQNRFTELCVVGLGYIGLPTAAMFATHNLKVIGVDVNPRVVETLQNGGIHIQEPGLSTLVQAATKSGNLTVSNRVKPAQAFIIAVPTPFLDEEDETAPYKKADMSYVRAAAESVVPHMRPGCLVILESTSPPRTTVDLVKPILERSGLTAGKDFYLAYSPERVLPGQILKELLENARVIGGINPASAEAGRDLYATFVRGEIVLTDATTAEMVKLMENTYRDVNIALANEFSRLAERFGIDVWQAIAIANRHPRVKILNPGPGVGGHCISVDPWFLVEAAPELTPLIRNARQVNDAQPRFVVGWLERILDGLDGKRIAALGLAYKPDVDDLRESPAIAVVHALVEAGAQVKVYEPYKPEVSISEVETVTTFENCLQDVDVILLLVPHRQFVDLKAEWVGKVTSARVMVDIVNGWCASEWEPFGFQVYGLGQTA
jgi:UDP-N-acetyl-D-mannosaminuronic acid dehydrogenase